MTTLIHARNGIIDKLVGDGLMAFWTAPSRGESHATDACLAALAQQHAVEKLREHLSDVLGLRRDLPEFSVRMGLATGDLVVGTIGAPDARSFTVIGDTVNLASRLEGANKANGGRITMIVQVISARVLIQPQLTASSSANHAIGTALMIPPVVGAARFQAALGTPCHRVCPIRGPFQILSAGTSR